MGFYYPRHHSNRGVHGENYGDRSPLQIDLRPTDWEEEYENREDAEPHRDVHPIPDLFSLLCLVAVFVLALIVISPVVEALFWKLR